MAGLVVVVLGGGGFFGWHAYHGRQVTRRHEDAFINKLADKDTKVTAAARAQALREGYQMCHDIEHGFSFEHLLSEYGPEPAASNTGEDVAFTIAATLVTAKDVLAAHKYLCGDLTLDVG